MLKKEKLFGRDKEKIKLFNAVDFFNFFLIDGASGIGKTSFISNFIIEFFDENNFTYFDFNDFKSNEILYNHFLKIEAEKNKLNDIDLNKFAIIIDNYNSELDEQLINKILNLNKKIK